MLITSVNDPEIFNPEKYQDNDLYFEVLSRHIDNLQKFHILLVCKGKYESTMLKTIRGYLSKLPPKIAYNFSTKLSALLTDKNKFIRLKPNEERIDKLSGLLDNISSKAAVGLSSYKNDVFIVEKNTITAMELAEIEQPEIYLLSKYSNSKARALERFYSEGIDLGNMTVDEMIAKVLSPLLYWAPTVRIIDKYINISAQGKKGDNWPIFKNTIRKIYEIWENGNGYKLDNTKERFEIISSIETKCPNEAELLAQKLDLPKKNQVVIKLKSISIPEEFHDRYIQTPRLTVGFSRGFDLINLDKLRPSSVYRHSKPIQALDDLIYSRNNKTFIW